MNKNMNNVDINVEFNETSTRQGLTSGESVKSLFGKIAKFFSDLKAVAFSGSYEDLEDKPDLSNSIILDVSTIKEFSGDEAQLPSALAEEFYTKIVNNLDENNLPTKDICLVRFSAEPMLAWCYVMNDFLKIKSTLKLQFISCPSVAGMMLYCQENVYQGTVYLGNLEAVANGGNADTVNQKTVLSDVPENAVFTDTTYDVVTTSANGLMSSTDKTKLDGIAENANNYSLPAATNSTLGGIKPDGTTITVTADGTISATAESITVDSELSATSENPVQNKVVKEALDGKVATVEGKGLSTNDYTAADKTKVNIITTTGDGSSYLANDGTYKAVESGDATVTDSTTGYVYSFVLENGSLKLRTYDDETTNT